MKKFISAILALTLMASLFAGCKNDKTEPDTPKGDSEPTTASTSSAEQVLYWNLGAEPKSLDPTLGAEAVTGHVNNNIFEGLYRTVNDKTVPGMATNHEVSDDLLTYTFHLREDAKWSDGEPVVAENFAFAWRRLVTPAMGAEYSTFLLPLKNAEKIVKGELDPSELGVAAPDEHTFVVTLERPTVYFEEFLTFPSLVPLREDVVDDEGKWAVTTGSNISNGPFKMTEYKLADRIILEKNENYWNKDTVKLDKIVVKMIKEESTVLTAYRSGELHIATNPPVEEIPMLEANGEITYIDTFNTYFIALNMSDQGEPALKDPKVVKALSLAIDRQNLIDNVLRAGQKPATGLVPFGFKDKDGKDFREIAGNYGISKNADIEEAKKLLAEAGYPNGEGLPTLEYAYNSAERHKVVGEFIQESLKEIGVNVELKNMDWAVFTDYRLNLQYKAMVRHAWVGDYQDPMTFLDLYYKGNTNGATGFKSAKYDEILEKAQSDSEKPYEYYKEAEAMLMEEAGIIPLFYDTQYVLVDNDVVVDWDMAKTSMLYFGNAYIADEPAE